MIFQARFTVHANREVKQPLLILDQGWLEGLTQNTSEPTATAERRDNGRLVLEYDTIPAGRKLEVWLQYRSNPDACGRDPTLTWSYGTATRSWSISSTR